MEARDRASNTLRYRHGSFHARDARKMSMEHASLALGCEPRRTWWGPGERLKCGKAREDAGVCRPSFTAHRARQTRGIGADPGLSRCNVRRVKRHLRFGLNQPLSQPGVVCIWWTMARRIAVQSVSCCSPLQAVAHPAARPADLLPGVQGMHGGQLPTHEAITRLAKTLIPPFFTILCMGREERRAVPGESA